MRKIGLSVTVTASYYMISILFYYFLRGKRKSEVFVFGGAACQHSTADIVMQSIRHRCVKPAFHWMLMPYSREGLNTHQSLIIQLSVLFPPYVFLSLKWENQLLKLQKRKIKHCKYTDTRKPVLKYSSLISFIHSFIISCPMHDQCVAQS